MPRINDELAGFLESGLPISVATRDADLQADGVWGWALRVDDDREHCTVYLFEKAAAAMLRNLDSHPEIAVVVDRPMDHRACQLKGLFESSRRARASERTVVERQREGVFGELEGIGIPRAMLAGWKWWPAVAVRFRVTHLYEQTPGPGAGEPMR